MPMAASRLPMPMPEIARPVVIAIAGAFAAAGLAVALVSPDQIWLVFAAAAGAVALILAFAFPVPACMAWLLAIGLTPDMWLGAFLGAGMAVAIVAALKVTGLVLVALALVRYGPRWDAFNPGLAFAAMFAAGLLHGLHPNLHAAESFRTLLGSLAPFAFCFVRLPRPWSRGIVRTVLCIPLASVLLGAGLAAAGLHPLLVEGSGLRLQGAGHPAFLGGFALAACCAAVAELLRTGRARHIGWLVLNLVILALSGARAPLAIGIAIIGLALLLAPAPRLSWPRRISFLLCAAITGAILLAFAGPLSADLLNTIRIFNLLATDADNLSGRDEIWPLFQAAWDASPWWGWGVGAGKVLLPLDTTLVRMLGTNAAHNEYLRIGMEGGYMGLGLLILCFVLWSARHLRIMRGSDRWVMLLVMIGFAVHSSTDNTLIATTSSVLFAWITAIFVRADPESPAQKSPAQESPK